MNSYYEPGFYKFIKGLTFLTESLLYHSPSNKEVFLSYNEWISIAGIHPLKNIIKCSEEELKTCINVNTPTMSRKTLEFLDIDFCPVSILLLKNKKNFPRLKFLE